MLALKKYRTLARKALSRPPAHVARRAAQELRMQAARPWVRVRPRLLRDSAVAGALGCDSVGGIADALARAPFFPLSGEPMAPLAASFCDRYPESMSGLLAAADRIVAHEFDLLGSGPRALGPELPWHADFKTGDRWPVAYAHDLDFERLTPESDVKVPWELSRFQHASILGQAWLLTADDRYRTEFVREVDDWDAQNPWGFSVNWVCAMDVAIRAHNLQWGYHYLFGPEHPAPAAFARRFARMLYLHGEFIDSHLEVSEVNGNHYLADAIGLVSIGAWFRHSPAGRRWLARGSRIVRDEIFSQVHADGVDFEQSTAYHRFVTEMFLTGFLLMRKAGTDPGADAWDRLERMFEYIAAYTRPDGGAPVIGDADDGRMQKLAPREMNDHRYLLAIAARVFDRADFAGAAGRFWEEAYWMLGQHEAEAFDAMRKDVQRGSVAFAEGGMYVLRAPGAHVVFDAAEVGMRGRGGHGHNDILSFELTLDGEPIIVDCGAFVYTAAPAERDRFRGTAFHNGVQVDGAEINRFFEPSDMWRLHDDARPRGVEWHPGAQGGSIAASHSGYERLPDPVSHRRCLSLAPDGKTCDIEDRLSGRDHHRYTWRFHLSPALLPAADGARVTLRKGERTWFIALLEPDGVLTLEDSWVSPSYGVKVPSRVVRWDTGFIGDRDVRWQIGIGRPGAVR